MNQISNLMDNIISIQIVDIVIAISIIVLFRIFSASLSYICIKMFKFKTKIRESAFYNPLRVFINLLGVYIAFLFLRQPLEITDKIIGIVTKAFQIISVIIFAKGLAASLTPESTIAKKVKKKTNREIEDSMFDFLLKVLRGAIYVVAGFIVITLLGINLNGLVAGLGISGVIVTLAAQDTAKNLFGGIVIFLDKPFVVGDWIEISEYEGTVEDITFRSTRVRTFENSLVNIPNSVIANVSIINWSKMEKRRYKTNLCIQIDTPLEKLEKFQKRVKEMLQERDAIYDDSIIVKFDEIKDNGINILVCSYTDSVDYPSYLAEKENINRKIMKILREENIELAYDTKTVYVKN